MNNRIHLVDNSKAILILLVVLGHFLEIYADSNTINILYKTIYSFHMPAFVFLSGYLFKPKNKKFYYSTFVLYALFQLVYVVSDIILFNKTEDLWLAIFTPRYLTWYLISYMSWCFIASKLKIRFTTIVISILISLLLGYLSFIDRGFSLSRTIYFMPFFFIGIIVKQKDLLSQLKAAKFIFVLLPIVFVLQILNIRLDIEYMWGVYSYTNAFSSLLRLLTYMNGIFTVWLFLIVTPSKKIWFSSIGKKTLPIYLFHGLVVNIVRALQLQFTNEIWLMTFCIVSSIFLVISLKEIKI